jgi:hypothetical protein
VSAPSDEDAKPFGCASGAFHDDAASYAFPYSFPYYYPYYIPYYLHLF